MVSAWANRLVLKFATVSTKFPDTIALDESHLESAFALSAEVNWNQTIDDWRTMLEAGNAIGMTAPGGRLVASALTLPYGDAFGWISMVLVTENWRKRGLATRLLGRCIKILEENALTPVLDATPEGEFVYRSLGFVPHYGIQRWEMDDASAIDIDPDTKLLSRPLGMSEMDEIKAYDQGVFGGDRGTVLSALWARSAGHARIGHQGRGYLLSRDGRVAHQIGPLCADDPAVAIDMLDWTLTGLEGPVFIDACDHQRSFIDRLRALGFKSQRSFLRMAKDRKKPFGDPERLYALAGPELG